MMAERFSISDDIESLRDDSRGCTRRKFSSVGELDAK